MVNFTSQGFRNLLQTMISSALCYGLSTGLYMFNYDEEVALFLISSILFSMYVGLCVNVSRKYSSDIDNILRILDAGLWSFILTFIATLSFIYFYTFQIHLEMVQFLPTFIPWLLGSFVGFAYDAFFVKRLRNETNYIDRQKKILTISIAFPIGFSLAWTLLFWSASISN